MVVTFDKFRLDTNTYQLFEDDRLIEVEPQVFSVLQVLIENRHRVVSKDDLINHVWRGRVMSDAAISSRIKSARQAIGDNGRAQRLIKTIHGIGFRFIGSVDATPSNQQSLIAQNSVDHSETDATNTRPSILILPFETSGNEPISILPMGLAHDLITGLSRLRWLKVISRFSAFRIADGSTDLQSLCKLTSIRYCLSGFLSYEGNQVRINFELTDLQNDATLLADQYALPSDQVNEIRADITKRLVSALELQISEHEAQRAQLKSAENLDAWEAYHLATAHLYRFTATDNQKATELFKRATKLEPQFARGHAGLSAAEFQNAFNLYSGINRTTAVNNAIRSAECSIELDRLDPLANFVMGRCHWLRDETELSIPWLERALSLNPNYAHGYYAHGLASLMTNNDRRVYKNSDQAISLSPLDPFLYGFYGIKAFSYLADEDIVQARIWAEKAAIQPEAIVVMDLLAAAVCEMDQDLPAAKKWIARSKQRNPNISSEFFFSALPFAQGQIRSLISSSLKRLSL